MAEVIAKNLQKFREYFPGREGGFTQLQILYISNVKVEGNWKDTENVQT